MLKIGEEFKNIIKDEEIVVYDMGNPNLNYGYTNGIAFPTTKNSEVSRTGLPDLSQYSGKKLTVFVRYGSVTSKNFCVGQTVIPNILHIQILNGYNDSRDLWMPTLRLTDYNSTGWKLTYMSSFVINNNNTITQDSNAREFFITKIIVE